MYWYCWLVCVLVAIVCRPVVSAEYVDFVSAPTTAQYVDFSAMSIPEVASAELNQFPKQCDCENCDCDDCDCGLNLVELISANVATEISLPNPITSAEVCVDGNCANGTCTFSASQDCADGSCASSFGGVFSGKRSGIVRKIFRREGRFRLFKNFRCRGC